MNIRTEYFHTRRGKEFFTKVSLIAEECSPSSEITVTEKRYLLSLYNTNFVFCSFGLCVRLCTCVVCCTLIKEFKWVKRVIGIMKQFLRTTVDVFTFISNNRAVRFRPEGDPGTSILIQGHRNPAPPTLKPTLTQPRFTPKPLYFLFS